MLIEETLTSGMRVWTARPDTEARRPAILVLHERYGPVQHSFNLVEKMAADGYVACVPDIYHRYTGDRGPIERAEARVDPTDEETLEDLDETIAHLRSLAHVDGDRIGIAGFCASGRTPLVFAAARNTAAAIAVFHGGVYPRDYEPIYPGQAPASELIAKLGCPVLGMFGELDRLVPLENVARFRQELEQGAKSYRIRVFAGVPHAWLNSTTADAYRPREAEDAWRTMVSFFKEVFAGEWETATPRQHFERDAAIGFDFASEP